MVMNIQGLQKMTLLDFPGEVACTVFLGGCNFRCPFCHNFGLVTGQVSSTVSEDEFFKFLAQRRGLLDGVAVTGGEPCLQPDLPDFLKKIKQFEMDVKLDTNGSRPDMLEQLVEQRLIDYVAMDIKSSQDGYVRAVGLEELDLVPIEASVAMVMSSGIPYEFRTTVVDGIHTEKDFEDIGKWLTGSEKYVLQPFVMSDAVPDDTLSAPSIEKLERYRSIVMPFIEHVEIRGIAH